MIGKIELEWEVLEKIAKYYQFPAVVFLLSKDYNFEEKTRDNALLKKIEKFKKELFKLIKDL